MRWLRPLRPFWRFLYPVTLLAAALTTLVALLVRSRRRPENAKRRAEDEAPPAVAADESLGWLTGITNIALVRKPVVFLTAAVVALVGLYSAFDIQQELFPEIDFPAITVITRFQGASPESIVDLVTEPTESAIGNVEGLQRLQSTTAEGVSVVVAEFDFGTDTETKEREIVSALQRLDLPDGADTPTVSRIDFGDFPIVAITVYGESSPEELEGAVRDSVVPALMRIDGVFTVSVTGTQESLLVMW